jgi:hypothetical protein
MSTVSSAGRQARRTAWRAANNRTLDRLARLGMVCRGVLYALIGILALQVAFGSGGHEADKGGAINAVAGQPFGTGVLWLMVVGFAALALWRLALAVIGSGRTVDRIEDAGRSVVYGLIVVTLFGVLLQGRAGESQDQQSRDVTSRLLDLPAGQLLVAAIGLGVIALGAYWLYQGLTRRFLEDLRRAQMSAHARSLAEKLGVAGYVARGAVAGLAGMFLVQAATRYDPEQARGIDATLRAFAETAAGPWLLVAVALGLLLFAGYCLCEARWHHG